MLTYPSEYRVTDMEWPTVAVTRRIMMCHMGFWYLHVLHLRASLHLTIMLTYSSEYRVPDMEWPTVAVIRRIMIVPYGILVLTCITSVRQPPLNDHADVYDY